MPTSTNAIHRGPGPALFSDPVAYAMDLETTPPHRRACNVIK